jgi:hypothetical protein
MTSFSNIMINMQFPYTKTLAAEHTVLNFTNIQIKKGANPTYYEN